MTPVQMVQKASFPSHGKRASPSGGLWSAVWFSSLLLLLRNLTTTCSIAPNLVVPCCSSGMPILLPFQGLCVILPELFPQLFSYFLQYFAQMSLRDFLWPTYINSISPAFPVTLLCFIFVAFITTWHIFIDFFPCTVSLPHQKVQTPWR